MTQLEIYKEALNVMREARIRDRWHWEFGYAFSGLCTLVSRVSDSYDRFRSDEACRQFVKDSEKVLGRELSVGSFWFTEIVVDEPKACAERIDHLNKLIKLYEQKDNKEEPKA